MTRSSFEDYAPSPQGSPIANYTEPSTTECRNSQSREDIELCIDAFAKIQSKPKWHFKCQFSKKRLLGVFLSCALLLVFLDYAVLLPNFGYINDDCYLSPEKLQDLRTAVIAIAEIFEKHNQTYWIDYGTLLGAYRAGDILPHDGDADISRLIPPNTTQDREEAYMDFFAYELNEKIGATTEWQKYVHFNNVNLDIARWVLDEDQNIYRYIPGFPIYTQIRRNFPGKPLPSEWFIPTGKIKFQGKMLAAPHNVDAILNYHYGNTVNVTVPYKWKCWIYSLFKANTA